MCTARTDLGPASEAKHDAWCSRMGHSVLPLRVKIRSSDTVAACKGQHTLLALLQKAAGKFLTMQIGKHRYRSRNALCSTVWSFPTELTQQTYKDGAQEHPAAHFAASLKSLHR